MKKPLVVVGVINWNGSKDTISCIESILESDYSNFHVVVLDNGSSDGSVNEFRRWARLRSDFDGDIDGHELRIRGGPFPAYMSTEALLMNVDLVRSADNLGFAGGANALARIADGHSPDYLWLLNSDATVSACVMSELVLCAQNNEDAIVGSLVVQMDCDRIEFARGRLPYDFFGWTPWRAVAPAGPWWPSDWATFASALIPFGLIRRRLRTQDQFLDEALFMYVEDVEFCLYAKSQGFRVVVCGPGKVRHTRSASSVGRASVRPLYYITRNRLFVAKRWFARPVALLFIFYYIPSRLLLQAWNVARGKLSIASAIGEGVVDGLLGIGGKWRRH